MCRAEEVVNLLKVTGKLPNDFELKEMCCDFCLQDMEYGMTDMYVESEELGLPGDYQGFDCCCVHRREIMEKLKELKQKGDV